MAGIGETIARHVAKHPEKKPVPTPPSIIADIESAKAKQALTKPEPTPEPVPTRVVGKATIYGTGVDRPTPPKPEPTPKEFYTPSELYAEETGLAYKAKAKEEKWKEEVGSTIDPKAKYKIPMIPDPVSGVRHASPQELEAYLATKPPGTIPQYQILTGAELLEMGERIYEPEKVTERLRWIAKQPSDTKFTRTPTGYKAELPPQPISLAEWKEQEYAKYKGDPLKEFQGSLRRGAATVLGGWGGARWSYERMAGDPQKAEEMITAWEYGATQASEKGFTEYLKYSATSPYFTGFIYPVGIGLGVGAGLGAFSATSIGAKPLIVSTGVTKAGLPLYTITPAKAAQLGLVGYGTVATGTGLAEIYSKGGMEELKWGIAQLGVSIPLAVASYKAGYKFGFGRTEAHLYKIKTYPPGTPERIRFEQGLKLGRQLQDVRSIKMKPLDFAKDIARMDEKTAQMFMRYYRGDIVIGGSAAARSQIIGARTARDMDIFLQRILLGTDKKISLAKQYFGKHRFDIYGRKVIDIHGKEMYKPGAMYRFGLEMKRPVKIGGYKQITAGELTFRKGVGSILLETKYRHGVYPGFPSKGTMPVPKDIADFVTHARSQITSLKGTWFSKGAVTRAEKALDIFLHPKKAPTYGISKPSLFEKFIIKTGAKPVMPKITYTPMYGYEFTYPKGTYPAGTYLGGLSAGYVAAQIISYKTPILTKYKIPVISRYELPPAGAYKAITPKYEAPILGGYPAPKREYRPTAKVAKVISYPTPTYPTYKPTPYPPDIPPPYTPPPPDYPPPYKPSKYPPPYLPGYPPPKPPPKKTMWLPTSEKKMYEAEPGFDVLVKDRYIVHGKKKFEEKFIKLGGPLTEQQAHALGKHLVDQSAAASYKIISSGRPARPPKLKVLPLGMTGYKFYKKKDKTGRTFIERTAHRIDSPGELQEITARGLKALMERQQGIIKRRKPPKALKALLKPPSFGRKQPKVSKMTFKPTDLRKEMKKIFGRGGFGF